MPNLYFQRDPVAILGKGACINRMKTQARRREVMLMEYVLKYHEDFKGTEFYYEKEFPYSIEGGDIPVSYTHLKKYFFLFQVHLTLHQQ